MYKVLLHDKYLLSYSTMINPLEPDVHHMMSQIVSIWLIFTQTCGPFFSIIFPIFVSLYLWNEKTVKGNVPDFSRLSDRTIKMFMSCHVMSCHVMSCHVMSCHVMSCHVTLTLVADENRKFLSHLAVLVQVSYKGV